MVAVASRSCAQCGASLAGRTERAFKGDSGTRLSRDLWITHLEADPYCSTACCRAAHGGPAENAAACLDCGTPFSNRRNGLSGPRCRDCANTERYKRYFFTSGLCGHCGCDLDAFTPGCWPCGDRRRRRERRAAERNVPAGLQAGSIEPPENGSPSGGDVPLYAAEAA